VCNYSLSQTPLLLSHTYTASQYRKDSFAAAKKRNMTTQQVADTLVQLCRAGKVEEAKLQLFSEETLSIEPQEGLLPKQVKGLTAIQKKAELFIAHVEQFYSDTLTDPYIAGDYFSIGWTSDLQMKGQERQTNHEICLYKVKDGKIISEQFFY
jgi:hypothetical protein